MAVDKLVDSTQLDADLTSVANAIRTKGGTSSSLAFPADFVSAINAISGGGGGGGKKSATGTFTPAERTGTASFDPGFTDVVGVVVVPTSESPLKSGGRTIYYWMSTPSVYLKSVTGGSNSSGSGTLAPTISATNSHMSQSGTTVTLSGGNGSFETVSYTWYAWQ